MGKRIVVSASFKKNAIKAILSILFFVIVYLSLIALSIGLTVLYGGTYFTLKKELLSYQSSLIKNNSLHAA